MKNLDNPMGVSTLKKNLLLAIFLLTSFFANAKINVQWHLKDIVNLKNPTHYGNLFKVCTITSDGNFKCGQSQTWIYKFQFNSNNPETAPDKIWLENVRSNYYNLFQVSNLVNGSFLSGDAAVIENDGGYNIFMEYTKLSDLLACKSLDFSLKVTATGLNCPNIAHESTSPKIFFPSVYATKFTIDEFNDIDLFMKDQDNDIGLEPNLQNANDVTKSVSILNTFYTDLYFPEATRYGINPGLKYPNQAQQSTLGKFNTMNILVENKGCKVDASKTSTATITPYWTMARTWEEWGKDWHNYDRYGTVANAQNNFAEFTDPVTGITSKKPKGNHLIVDQVLDYASEGIDYPIGGSVNSTRAKNSGPSISYENSGIQYKFAWNAPDARWYKGITDIQRNKSSLPVICFLAVLNEPYRPNNGFYQTFAINSNTPVTQFAEQNNNVATVNAVLLTPNSLYKHQYVNNQFESDLYSIEVNSPRGFLQTPSLSILPNIGSKPLNENASLYVYFDNVLWEKWRNRNFEGTGFTIVQDKIVKITTSQTVTFNGIQLNEGESGVMALKYTYDGNNPPSEDFIHHVSVGFYDQNKPNVQIGSPSHFLTHVIKVS